jgi:hypothetical protein
MTTRSKDSGWRPGSTHPRASLALILIAAVTVYACDRAAAPTGLVARQLRVPSGVSRSVVTPGVITICKVGPGATFQVRVDGGAPQTYTVTDGNCTTVATVNPAAPDDVIVSVAENVASYYKLNHIVIEQATNTPRTITGTNTVSFEGAHGAVVTFHNDAVVNVCKMGTNATFQYQIGLGDSFHPLSLNDGQCSPIATIPPAGADDVIVTVRENASAAYKLDHLTLALGPLSPQTITGTSSTSFEGVHGATVVFHNVPVTPPTPSGCTFTQGYYKNKGKNLLPGGTFFLSGQSWHSVLETAPKQGNAYYILAHQYIAAVMNAKSASVPSSVAAAIASATTYFGKATPDDWSAGDAYSKNQLTSWADLLDSYNNGQVGPGHCDD